MPPPVNNAGSFQDIPESGVPNPDLFVAQTDDLPKGQPPMDSSNGGLPNDAYPEGALMKKGNGQTNVYHNGQWMNYWVTQGDGTVRPYDDDGSKTPEEYAQMQQEKYGDNTPDAPPASTEEWVPHEEPEAQTGDPAVGTVRDEGNGNKSVWRYGQWMNYYITVDGKQIPYNDDAGIQAAMDEKIARERRENFIAPGQNNGGLPESEPEPLPIRPPPKDLMPEVDPYPLPEPRPLPAPLPPADEPFPLPLPPANEPRPLPPVDEPLPLPLPPVDEPLPLPPIDEPLPVPPIDEPGPLPPIDDLPGGLPPDTGPLPPVGEQPPGTGSPGPLPEPDPAPVPPGDSGTGPSDTPILNPGGRQPGESHLPDVPIWSDDTSGIGSAPIVPDDSFSSDTPKLVTPGGPAYTEQAPGVASPEAVPIYIPKEQEKRPVDTTPDGGWNRPETSPPSGHNPQGGEAPVRIEAGPSSGWGNQSRNEAYNSRGEMEGDTYEYKRRRPERKKPVTVGKRKRRRGRNDFGVIRDNDLTLGGLDSVAKYTER